ncbi:ATP-binding protein [Spirulina sp. CCNP1310]|uniref:ATP-binding protein n=1 Tax=Spirulina sp. CCNP1310 TaxID=3110249 RepID=UPI002B220364|nr:ATP-binding protein [Spirulina sp. CCNP1310]MEA5418616.1 ATP-binding protein [Spirulina sp. CCNP1310]
MLKISLKTLRKSHIPRLNCFPVWLMLTLGIGLGASTSFLIYRWESIRIQENLSHQSRAIRNVFQSNLNQTEQLARSLAAIYSLYPELNDKQFEAIANQIFRDQSVVEYIGFSMINSKRTDSFDLENKIIYPPFLESRWLTFPHLEDWKRQWAIEKASQTGVVSTTITTLPQQDGEKSGFITYIPVYQDPLSTLSIDQLSEKFIGVAHMTFSISDLFADVIKQTQANSFNIYLYELPIDQVESGLQKTRVSIAERLLFNYPDDLHIANQGDLTKKCPIENKIIKCLESLSWNDVEMTLLILPQSSLPQDHWRSLTFFLVSISITGLSSWYLLDSAKHRQQQARLITELNLSKQELKGQKQELQELLEQLLETQSQLIHAEKMSGLGEMAAGIAHEVNNPINFISGNLDYALQYSQDLLDLINLYRYYFPQHLPVIEKRIADIEFDFIALDFPRVIQSMQSGVKRVQNIIQSMRSFSRVDEAAYKFVDIHEGLESTLMILNHRIFNVNQYACIEIHKKYANLPEIECYPSQLNQVFMNILSNGIDAIHEAIAQAEPPWQPMIRITTEIVDNHWCVITIADNGNGIPEDIKSKIFNPFFTTKAIGKGTGLGLSISYKIITEFHHGQLLCESRPGAGTTFTIKIPTTLNRIG